MNIPALVLLAVGVAIALFTAFRKRSPKSPEAPFVADPVREGREPGANPRKPL